MTLAELSAAIEAVSARYAHRFGIRRDTDWCVLKLTEEIGELTRAHLKLSGQARVSESEAGNLRQDFENELADVLGQLLVLAQHAKVDLEAAVERKWLRWHPSRLTEENYREQSAV